MLGDVAALSSVAVGIAGVVVLALGLQRLQGLRALIEGWRAEHREERFRAQAELVCAWPVSERETFEKVITRGVVGSALRNASEFPVYAVEIVYRDPEAAWTAVKRVRMLPPSGAAEVYAGFDEEETHGEPAAHRVNEDGTIRLAESAQMRVELRFTDGQGRRWVRAENGLLSLAE